MKRTLLALTAAGLLAGPVRADVKVTYAVRGEGRARATSGAWTYYLKGRRMRMEHPTPGGLFVSIVDLETMRSYVLDPAGKEVEVRDLTRLWPQLRKRLGTEQATSDLRPNGRKKTILGHVCDGYDVTYRVPVERTAGKGREAMTLAGQVWIARGVAGFPDFAGFYQAGIAQGMFGPKGASPQGQADVYWALSADGMVLEEELSEVVADGAPSSGYRKTVTAISTATLGDEVFLVPSAYQMVEK